MKRLVVLCLLALLLAFSVSAVQARDVAPTAPVTPAISPRPVTATAGVPGATMVGLALGNSHTCGLTAQGTVWCWGANGSGQLGDGTTTPYKTYSVNVHGLSGVTAIAAGGETTCALTTGGGVKCWGSNNQGQLGNNSTTDSRTPVDVQTSSTITAPLSGVTAIAVGSQHTCALLESGSVKCWGMNGSGQLGVGTTFLHSLTPVDVHASSTITTPLTGVTAIGLGYYFSCAVMTGGSVKCWGQGGHGQLGNNLTDNIVSAPVNATVLTATVAGIAGGQGHTCARTTAGSAKCWGYAYCGQLGDGASYTSTYHRLTPVQVSGLETGVIAVGAGNTHSCAVLATGEIKCWGYNYNGQLGNMTKNNSSVPVNVFVDWKQLFIPFVKR